MNLLELRKNKKVIKLGRNSTKIQKNGIWPKVLIKQL